MSARTSWLLGALVALGACSSAESMPPGVDAAPPATGVFAEQVQPILSARCLGCHGETSPTLGLRLGPVRDEAEELEILGGLVGVASAQLPAMPLITAGDPANSYLLYKAENRQSELTCPTSCQGRMPPAGALMTAGEIEVMRGWIAGGAGGQ